MTVLPLATEAVKFHTSLNVRNLDRSVDFYRTLFGREPAKRHADYAKFEIDDPPIVFSLSPHPAGPGASLSHLGLRVDSDAVIAEYRTRLETAGIGTQAQDGTTCGYALQNKLWVQDPDGNFWEIYRVEEDVRPEAVRRSLEGRAARAEVVTAVDDAEVWEHFVTHPLPARIPHADQSLAEVRLTGTFNGSLDEPQRAFLIAEAARVLKPGGKVLTHGLMADRPFPGATPTLPGLAAMVSHVPVQTGPAKELQAAGFVGLQIVKYAEKPWIVHDGVELREVKWVAWKPSAGTVPESRLLLYKGPFRETTADGGLSFQRGVRVTVPSDVWHRLRLGPAADQFLFFEPGEAAACGVGPQKGHA